jgi:hypothetical protein
MEGKTIQNEMATSTKMVKISQREYDRLVKFGVAGESVNTALERVLDIAEEKEKKNKGRS